MNTEQLKQLIAENKIDEMRAAFEINRDVDTIKKAIKQYDPKQHDVHDKVLRKDKMIPGETVVDDDGKEKKEPDVWVDVHRLSIPVEKKIVLLAAAFLGNPTLEATQGTEVEQELLEALKKIWRDNKLDYKFKKCAKITMSETECAELWYAVEEQDYWKGTKVSGNRKFKMKLLHNSYDKITGAGNDDLYPVFDNYGDMIAFGRGYETKDGEKKIKHLDVYTADRFYFFKTEGDIWTVNTFEDNPDLQIVGDGLPGVPNIVGKIPVIYYSQPLTEWHDVSELIHRLETKISNHADTNDYTDDPILFAEGDVEGFANKGERGKVLQGRLGAKVSWLTWDQAPESTKMEIENLLTFIHEYTHTPRATFEQMKGLGYFSTIALKTLFMDAHMKAADKEEIMGECVQRRINYLKTALSVMDSKFAAVLNYDITAKFQYFMPENTVEIIDTLIKVKNAGGLSQQSFIEQNPLVQDPEAELELIEKDEEKKAKEEEKNKPPFPPNK